MRNFRITKEDYNVVYFTLKIKALRAFETSIIIYPMIRQHVAAPQTT